MKNMIRLILVALLCAMTGCGSDTQAYLEVSQTEAVSDSGQVEAEESIQEEAIQGESDTQADSFMIYICGEVINPGVYEMEAGSRICDAVEAAGGLTEEASRDYWNLAEPLVDGQMISFPTKEEARERQEAAGVAVSSTDETTDGRVNINTAALEELMTIPGIGQTRGEAIIAYREEHGGFESAEDIMKVSGIKDALYAKMKDYITVD